MWRWLFWWRPPCVLRLVIVHLYPEEPNATQAIKGVLWQSRGQWLVLREATWQQLGHDPRPLDGEVVVPRRNVMFIQAFMQVTT